MQEPRVTKEQAIKLKAVGFDYETDWWEFRDYGSKDLCRDGILKASVCESLMSLGLLDMGDGMDWHTTFHITEKGKLFIECLNTLQ